jgi:glycosyltransferase involved in cell wall biosynthesis
VGGPRSGVCYFGHIAPGKGIETLLEVRRRLSSDVPIALVGQTPPQFKSYCEAIVHEAESLGIAVHLNEPVDRVARILSSSVAAILPFPDGISLRRGSALAAMANGALVITTKPYPGSEVFEDLAVCCGSTDELAEAIDAVHRDATRWTDRREAAMVYANSSSWPAVAASYVSAIRRAWGDCG